MDKKISVLTSVYKNDIPESVKIAIDSIENQTLKPDEVIFLVDGPVNEEMNSMLDKLQSSYPNIKLIRNEVNLGLGKTLQKGMLLCSNELVARMDTDDIALPDRFEKQINAFEKDPDLSIVGTCGIEFIGDESNTFGVKAVPETNDEIQEYIKSRCPFCHMSVMMKKSMCLKAGNYQDWYFAEDYYMWIRMALSGAKFYNIQENLMHIRINENTYVRRHGLKYYNSLKNLFKYMYNYKMISWLKYKKNCMVRFIAHVITPKKAKMFLYKKCMRKKEH